MEVCKLNKMIKLSLVFIFIFIFSCQSNQDNKKDAEKETQWDRLKHSDELMYKYYNKMLLVSSDEYTKLLPSLMISPEKADQLLLEYCLKESREFDQRYYKEKDRDEYISKQALVYKNSYFLAGIDQNKYIYLLRAINKSKTKDWYIIYNGISIDSKNGEISKMKPLEIPMVWKRKN